MAVRSIQRDQKPGAVHVSRARTAPPIVANPPAVRRSSVRKWRSLQKAAFGQFANGDMLRFPGELPGR